jgi:hypothetical protein
LCGHSHLNRNRGRRLTQYTALSHCNINTYPEPVPP